MSWFWVKRVVPFAVEVVPGQDAFGFKVFHVLVGDFDADRVEVLVKFCVDGQSGAGGGRRDGLDDLVNGRPRQFIEMWENSRCSILFHLLVPDGRWHTVIVRPVVAASSASSVFHCRVRYPLEPPPSRRSAAGKAFGCNVFPAFRHQVAMVFTANAAVSWSVPTPTRCWYPRRTPRTGWPCRGRGRRNRGP